MNENKNIRIKDIAKMAGVSVGTVDRVLHNRGNVSDEAEQKVKKVLKKTSYTPDPIAQSLGSKKDFEIVALMPHPKQDEYWALSDAGITHAKKEWDPYDINIKVEAFDLNDPASFDRASQHVLDSKPDAVLTAPVYFDKSLHFFKNLQSAKIPFILINTQIDKQIKKFNPLCIIGQNLYQSGRVAAELMHITMRKPEKLAVMHIHENIDNAMHLKEKERGFRAYYNELTNWEGEIHSFLIVDNDDPFESQISNCIDKTDLDGIFVPTSSGTFRTARAMRNHGSENIALIGYDLLEQNIRFLEAGTINFLINQDPRYQALQGLRYLANHLLLKLEVPSSDLLPLEIITRQNYHSFLKRKN